MGEGVYCNMAYCINFMLYANPSYSLHRFVGTDQWLYKAVKSYVHTLRR